jgi:hypothetical protein
MNVRCNVLQMSSDLWNTLYVMSIGIPILWVEAYNGETYSSWSLYCILYKQNLHDWNILLRYNIQCWKFRRTQNYGKILWVHFIVLDDPCLHPDIFVCLISFCISFEVSLYCLFRFIVCCQIVFTTASVEWNLVLCTKPTTPYKISLGN